ncbi:MAG TPA: hypothetical protein VGJ61_05515 [Solirubrobacterales bacterium]|jgi:hypothetical protein
MRMGNLKAVGVAILIAPAALGLAACGSGGTETTTVRPALSVATADRLATLSDRIATDLDAGDTCHAAHAADDLSSAIQEADLPATLRPGVEATAGRLVDQVNCPPPPPPPPEEKKKPKEDKQDEHKGGEQSKNGGLVPPGQAKLKGEPG